MYKIKLSFHFGYQRAEVYKKYIENVERIAHKTNDNKGKWVISVWLP